jgi:hypothetical protein
VKHLVDHHGFGQGPAAELDARQAAVEASDALGADEDAGHARGDRHHHGLVAAHGQPRPVDERELEQVAGRTDAEGLEVGFQRAPAAILEVGEDAAARRVVQPGRGPCPHALHHLLVVRAERAVGANGSGLRGSSEGQDGGGEQGDGGI